MWSYGGNTLKVSGQITVPICYQQQEATLPLVVVKAAGEAVPLFGRTWLTTLILDWPKLFPHAAAVRRLANVTKVTDANHWREKYPEDFAGGLGTVKDMEAKLHNIMKEGAVPKFCKPRPVPFSLKPAVDRELQRMEDESIIERVEFSDWATPLVCTPKTDCTVRVCGDNKVTVNPCLNVA